MSMLSISPVVLHAWHFVDKSLILLPIYLPLLLPLLVVLVAALVS